MPEPNAEADLTGDLGKYLQKQREERRISIETLSSKTRIPERFVKAMEANRFEALPNPVSTKGFLRSYANFVGLDGEKVLEAFSRLEVASRVEAFTQDQEKTLSYLHVKKSTRLPFPSRVAFSVGGIILLLSALAYFLPPKEISIKSPPSLPKFSLQRPKKPESSFPKGTASDLPRALLETSPNDQTKPQNDVVLPPEGAQTVSPGGGEVDALPNLKPGALEGGKGAEEVEKEIIGNFSVLSIEAREPSWVQVIIDGLETREALLQPGESVRWKAKEAFLLTLGNAGGVAVSLDGETLQAFGPSGEVVHKEIRVRKPALAQSE